VWSTQCRQETWVHIWLSSHCLRGTSSLMFPSCHAVHVDKIFSVALIWSCCCCCVRRRLQCRVTSLQSAWSSSSISFIFYVSGLHSALLRSVHRHSCHHHSLLLLSFIYFFIYYTVYTHVKSFTIVKNRKCGQVMSHCRKARPYRADLSLFLNLPVVTVIGSKWALDHNCSNVDGADIRAKWMGHVCFLYWR